MKKIVSVLLLFLFFSCKSVKKDENLVLLKDYHEKIGFPYKPNQIKISYNRDSIFIKKTFLTGEEVKYSLYLKGNKYFFINKGKTPNGNYSKYPFLLFKNRGDDSCFSITKSKINNRVYIPNTENIDLCLTKIQGGGFTTITRFNTRDSLSFSENFFYDKNYRVYKIALRINDTLYWYKIKN